MIKVSICIPAYNNAEEVKRLLDSIAQQTYQSYEVVITDDSTDGAVEELVKSRTDSRIQYEHNKEKLGHIFNWNRAISLATGEYIKIMFSDDWFTYDNSLEEYVRLLDENPDVDFAFSGSMQVSDKVSYERKIPDDYVAFLREDYRHLLLGNQIGAPSGTIYRNKGIMFDENSNWASDMFLYFNLLCQNNRFTYSKKPLVSIGLHGEQYTHMFQERDERIFQDYYYMYQKYNLAECAVCRQFFLKEYIMKFGKGCKTAGSCGISPSRYMRTKIAYLWQNKVVDYLNETVKRVGKLK